MKTPADCPTVITMSWRYQKAEMNRIRLPARLRDQKATGTVVSLRRSEASHCTMKRRPKRICPSMPNSTQPFTCSRRSNIILHLVAQLAPLHPAHGQQVHERRQEPVADAVLRFTMAAGPVPDRNLLHPEPFHLQESRQEAVHPVVEHQTLEGRPAERLERAAGVGDRLVAQPVANVVGDPRRNAPHEIVLAFPAHS